MIETEKDTENSEKLEAAEMQKALEVFDESVPGVFLTEILAQDLAALLGEYHKTEIARQSAKQANNDQRREALWKSSISIKHHIAWIQYKYPETKPVAETIMKASVKQNENNRERLLRTQTG